MKFIKWILGIISGAVIATIASCSLTYLLYAVFDPASLNDGQAILMFIPSFPVMTIVGGVAGFAWQVWTTKRKLSYWTLIVAGLIGSFLVGFIAFLSASTRGSSFQGFIGTPVSPWAVAPFVISVIISITGVWLMFRGKRS